MLIGGVEREGGESSEIQSILRRRNDMGPIYVGYSLKFQSDLRSHLPSEIGPENDPLDRPYPAHTMQVTCLAGDQTGFLWQVR